MVITVGYTASLFCRNGHKDVVRYLVSEADCNPCVMDNDGQTPLHKACRWANGQTENILCGQGGRI